MSPAHCTVALYTPPSSLCEWLFLFCAIHIWNLNSKKYSLSFLCSLSPTWILKMWKPRGRRGGVLILFVPWLDVDKAHTSFCLKFSCQFHPCQVFLLSSLLAEFSPQFPPSWWAVVSWWVHLIPDPPHRSQCSDEAAPFARIIFPDINFYPHFCWILYACVIFREGGSRWWADDWIGWRSPINKSAAGTNDDGGEFPVQKSRKASQCRCIGCGGWKMAPSQLQSHGYTAKIYPPEPVTPLVIFLLLWKVGKEGIKYLSTFWELQKYFALSLRRWKGNVQLSAPPPSC